MSTQQRQHPRPHARPQHSRPQMAQRPARRLPPARRLDYILIPAPLDLTLASLSSLSEKSPLPAIIVTPSSPTRAFRTLSPDGCDPTSPSGFPTNENGLEDEEEGAWKGREEHRYSIAFMVQPPKPSVLERTKEKVKQGARSMRESISRVGLRRPLSWSSLSSWRAMRGDGYAPISLPISAPPSQTEFSIPTFPAEKKRSANKVVVVLTAVFVLVFCHMLAHFFTRASLPTHGMSMSGGASYASPASLDLASTSPILSSTSDVLEAGVATGAGTATGGEKTKAYYAFLGKLEVKQWLAWAVGGKK